MATDITAIADKALALHQAGQLKDAAPLYDRALAARPQDARLLGLAGALQLQMGKLSQAVKLLKRAVAQRRDHAEAWNNLGVAHLQTSHFADAATAFTTVTALQPDNAAAWTGLGQAEREQGRRAEAVTAFRRALALRPDDAGILGSLGAVLESLAETEEAEALLGRALDLHPTNPGLHNSLAMVFTRRKQWARAEASLRKALALRPDYPLALRNLADVVNEQRRPVEAEQLLTRALALMEAGREPRPAAMLGALLSARTQCCNWRDREKLLAQVLSAGGDAANPFELLWQDVPPVRQRRVAEAFARTHDLSSDHDFQRPAILPRRDGRIRVGYLSADFYDHATAVLVTEVLEQHDRGRFELHGFSTGPDDGRSYRQRLMAAMEQFHDLRDMSEPEIAARIAAQDVDVLIDLKGWTQDQRVVALSLRPAPVQVTWLGYPGTLGAAWVDYAIVDPVIAPDGYDAHYSEKLVRLPYCYQPNDRQRRIAATPDRAAAGLPPEGLVLACFCQASKISPAVFSLWMRAMRALPGSVLWLLDALPAAKANLCRTATEQGVDASRLIFAPKIAVDQHLARYRLVDLALDTMPYGSHTTASDVLWAGCLQLALTGESFAGRVSTSIVTAAGMPELATPDLATHEAMIIRLGRDAEARAALCAKLAAQRDTAPLFDAPRFVRHLEAAYVAIHERHRAGLPPAAITIPAGD